MATNAPMKAAETWSAFSPIPGVKAESAVHGVRRTGFTAPSNAKSTGAPALAAVVAPICSTVDNLAWADFALCPPTRPFFRSLSRASRECGRPMDKRTRPEPPYARAIHPAHKGQLAEFQ